MNDRTLRRAIQLSALWLGGMLASGSLIVGSGCIELQQMLDPPPADSTSAIVFFNENESTDDNQSEQTNDNVDDTDNVNDNDSGCPEGIPPLPAGVPLIPTSSGVQIAELATGEGELLEEGDTIVVNYTGWLDDGTAFDCGEGVELLWDHDSLIDGWIDGMTGMRVGGSRRLVIPPELAYGSVGSPPSIPPDATLTFDVDVLEIL